MNTLFDLHSPGRIGLQLPACDVPQQSTNIPGPLLRESVNLPEVSEVDVVRHFTKLSKRTYGVDDGFYPLGSCTMKYNPKINEDMARLAGFAGIHPMIDAKYNQGALELMYNLEQDLCEITGMSRMTLTPAAGSHGELVGVMIMRKYFDLKGQKRTKIIVPDSSHGTNPASAAICEFEIVTIPSDSHGYVDMDALKKELTPDVAGMMLTNPNTLGLFDPNIEEIASLLHANGSLFYCDGANANAIVGMVKIADMGFDIVHLNLHKTFSTPHGCGGPGAGPVGVTAELADYLPTPLVDKSGDGFVLNEALPKTIGRIRANMGNFGVLVRAYTFIKTHGREGIPQIAQHAVLNANYLKARLQDSYFTPFTQLCKHEFILSDKGFPNDVTTTDIAKRLLDKGFYAPTIYFPLIVPGAIMIEPTETESKQTLDSFADAMLAIKKEAAETPDIVLKAPRLTPVGRLDAVLAARKPVLSYDDISND